MLVVVSAYLLSIQFRPSTTTAKLTYPFCFCSGSPRIWLHNLPQGSRWSDRRFRWSRWRDQVYVSFLIELRAPVLSNASLTSPPSTSHLPLLTPLRRQSNLASFSQ